VNRRNCDGPQEASKRLWLNDRGAALDDGRGQSALECARWVVLGAAGGHRITKHLADGGAKATGRFTPLAQRDPAQHGQNLGGGDFRDRTRPDSRASKAQQPFWSKFGEFRLVQFALALCFVGRSDGKPHALFLNALKLAPGPFDLRLAAHFVEKFIGEGCECVGLRRQINGFGELSGDGGILVVAQKPFCLISGLARLAKPNSGYTPIAKTFCLPA